MGAPVVAWLGFAALFATLLGLDLGVFNRGAKEISAKRALISSAAWMGLAALFNVGMWALKGPQAAMEFVGGYVVEQMLSVDNLFVFLSLFSFFRVPRAHQHKVLFWGVIGAAGLRLGAILGGMALVQSFHWLTYGFGGLLVWAAVKMIREKEGDDKEGEVGDSAIVRALKKVLPLSEDYDGDKFFTKVSGKTLVTPLLLVLMVVEATDMLFAMDSIPAVFGVTKDPFVAITSNLFAVLGLRSLFFAVSSLIKKFSRLGQGVAAILGFVGLKMLLGAFLEIPIAVSLGVIGLILAASIAASKLWPKK
jgi:tellurite resistance protein TerC